MSPESEEELYLERCAVREYEAGIPRDEAERLAREDVRRMVDEDGEA